MFLQEDWDLTTWTVRETGATGLYNIEGSANGATFISWDPDAKTQYNMISFCGSQFVAIGGVTISTATDGVNWTNRQSNPVSIPAQTPVKFIVGRDFYYLGPENSPIFMDTTPYIDDKSGRTMVPVRRLANALGAQTRWDAHTQTITIASGNTTVSMVIGSTILTVNSQKQTTDVAPEIRAGRMYLPAKYVAEALGYSVSWDASSQTVTISQAEVLF